MAAAIPAAAYSVRRSSNSERRRRGPIPWQSFLGSILRPVPGRQRTRWAIGPAFRGSTANPGLLHSTP